VAGRIGNKWLIAGAAVLTVLALGWAWHDGGQQPLRLMSAPTTLPTVVQ
jgi:hypothetical protein